ncbi:MAG: TcpQ domain-containing protein [Gammaproteobacteria bacterium]
MPRLPTRRPLSTIGRWVALAGILILGGDRTASATRPYHFDFRVHGTRCLPKLVFSSRRDLYLWMSRSPACRPVGATMHEGLRAKEVPIFHERPYWVIAGRAPRITVRFEAGQIVVRPRATHPTVLQNRQTSPCASPESGDTRLLAQSIHFAPGCDPRAGAGRGAPGIYRVSPGSAHAQVALWAMRAHWHLFWQAPDWIVPTRLRLAGPLLHAVRQLLDDAEKATGRRYALVANPRVHAFRIDRVRAPLQPDRLWAVTPGTLRTELLSWAQKAGYQVIWHAPADYLLTAHAMLHGSFVQAVTILVKSLDRTGSSVRIAVYRKNRVLVVAGGI